MSKTSKNLILHNLWTEIEHFYSIDSKKKTSVVRDVLKVGVWQDILEAKSFWKSSGLTSQSKEEERGEIHHSKSQNTF